MITPYSNLYNINKKTFSNKMETINDYKRWLKKRLETADKMKNHVRHAWVIGKELEVALHMLETLEDFKNDD